MTNATTNNEVLSLSRFNARRHHMEIQSTISAEQRLDIQKVRTAQIAEKYLVHASQELAAYITMPNVDAGAAGKAIGASVEAFIGLVGLGNAEQHKDAFKKACTYLPLKGHDGFNDVDVALCAFIPEGKVGMVTRNPHHARAWCEDYLVIHGTPAKRINKGAYIVCTPVPTFDMA